MTVFTRGVYAIKFNNSAYIKAIAKYGHHTFIEKMVDIRGKELIIPEDKKQLSNLPTIVQELSERIDIDQVQIQYRTGNSSSLIGVFPPVPRIRPVPVSRTAISYLNAIVFNCTNRGDMAMYRPSAPTALSREEALSLIQQYDCSGAIELKKMNTIVFEHDSTCFHIAYGKPCHMGDMNNMTLDIDDGFFFKEAEVSSLIVRSIAKAMQPHFSAWKERSYEGDLFSLDMGLQSTFTATSGSVSTVGMFAGAGSPSPLTFVSIEAVDNIDFKEIDERIEHDGVWRPRYPMGTTISIPTSLAKEILDKLKVHTSITSVDGELTEKGKIVHAKIADAHFSHAGRP